MAELVARDEELAAIVALLAEPERLPRAAVLCGDAGVGKTTLWLAAVDAAATHCARVLVTRPTEAETTLTYAGLSDLLGPVADELLPGLPPVQRRALEAALLLGDVDVHVDERAVAAAFLAGLRALAVEPLCLAVDDLQWLDTTSLGALRFALNRLRDEPVAALFTVRGEAPAWLRRELPGVAIEVAHVGGLSLGATHELLRARLGASFSRPTLIRLWETSGGNPLFALELASALQRRNGAVAPGDPLPIPSTLDGLLGERLDRLDDAALEVARVVAVAAEPTTAVVEAALGDRADAGLDAALEAGIVEVDAGLVRFSHPLLASAVAVRQMPAGRRALHARLADVVPTTEERARHLALATVEPDREIAALLDTASQSAYERGAPPAAAELAEHALRLTPPDDVEDARRRLILAAVRHDAAGDTNRAIALLTEERARAAPGPDRVEVLVTLQDMLAEAEPRAAATLMEEALGEVEHHDGLAAMVHLRMADSMRWRVGIDAGLAHATLAVEAAGRTDDLVVRCTAIATLADWRFRAGHGISRDELEEALAIERTLPDWPLVGGPAEYYGHQLVWAVELDPARTSLLEILEARQARNEAAHEAWVLWELSRLEWRAGNWDEADRHAARSVELLTQLGRTMCRDEFLTAAIAAHRGRVDEARLGAEAAIAHAETEGLAIGQSFSFWVLGFVELSLGDATAAVVHLTRSYESRSKVMLEPAQRVELGDLLEALVAVGELDRAEEIVSLWEGRAQRLDRAWSLAILARGRGLLRAARGDVDGAFASFERALGEHARCTDPFQHARTLLALGRTQRRAKRRAAARMTLEDALARFERLGAPLWAEQTRAELSRIGGRAPAREDLTEGESKIARLVAEGRTNREVADALFLTVHSVETALTRIYRKLGVRSRAELASHYAANA